MSDDPQVRALEEATRPESLVEQIEEAYREAGSRPSDRERARPNRRAATSLSVAITRCTAGRASMRCR